jgi:predicted secreted protein
MNKPLLLAMLLAPAPAMAETILHLSEQAQVMVNPDELAATLRLEADGPDAATVQNRVNTGMTQALAQARATEGVVATTGFYQVFNMQPANKPAIWHSVQTLNLHGTDGAAMLTLVGHLQAAGAAINQLGWRVAAATARHARDEASNLALSQLRARAEAAAGILGLKFASFRDITLGGPPPFQPVMPRAMVMSSSNAGGAPPPEAASEPVAIEASVSADVVLAGG